MNFTFVTHKGARPEKSELVKSHVMRESQRKRRAARQRKNEQGRAFSPVHRTSPPVQTDLSGPPSHVEAHATIANVAFDTNTLDAGTELSYSSNPIRAPSLSTLLQDSRNYRDNIRPWDQDARPVAADAISLYAPSKEVTLWQEEIPNEAPIEGSSPTDPHTWAAARSIYHSLQASQPFLHPDFVVGASALDADWTLPRLLERNARMNAFYTDTRLFEESGSTNSVTKGYWLEVALRSQKILFCTSLYYCALRDLFKNIKGDDHGYFMSRTLQLINKALDDPNERLAEDTIASVISVCMYENILGSENVVTHLQGLQQMINLKGGINSLPADQGQSLAEMSILQDIMHAVGTNVGPYMLDIIGPTLRDMRTQTFEFFYPESPLRIINNDRFTLVPIELRSCTSVLADAFEGFEMLCIEAFDEDTARDQHQEFRSRKNKFFENWVLCQTGLEADEELSLVEKKAQEVILLAARIHFRACACKVQHEDERNKDDMRRIHDLIRTIDSRFWRSAHYVYLWILLTATAASHGHPQQHPYFMSEILRLGLSIGLFDWRSFRLILGNFLWLQQFLRQEPQEQMASDSQETMW